MKKSILILPFFALATLLSSCENDSDYAEYREPQVDVEEISRAVNDAMREAFADSRFNDTIFNCADDEMTKSVMITASDSTATSMVITKMPEIKVSVTNNDNGWIDLKKEKNEKRSIVAIVSVIAPCLMLVAIAAMVLLFFYGKIRNRNRVIEKAIEANYQLPVEFYTNSGNQTNPVNEIKTTPTDGSVPPPLPRNERLRVGGMRLVAIGLGLIIMLGVWGGMNAAVIGIIPLLIGGSYLANYYNILK